MKLLREFVVPKKLADEKVRPQDFFGPRQYQEIVAIAKCAKALNISTSASDAASMVLSKGKRSVEDIGWAVGALKGLVPGGIRYTLKEIEAEAKDDLKGRLEDMK